MRGSLISVFTLLCLFSQAQNRNSVWCFGDSAGIDFRGKIGCFEPAGLIELFNFDRCSGAITLNQAISPEATMAPYPFYIGAEFSPNENYLYVSRYSDVISTYPSYLFQLDLMAGNILASADTIWYYDASPVASGKLKLAGDGKVYMACAYYDGINYNYPYPDSLFNIVNNNTLLLIFPIARA